MSISKSLARLCRISLCLAIALGFIQVTTFASQGASKTSQQNGLWKEKSENSILSRGKRLITPEKYVVFELNQDSMKRILDTAPLEFTPAARLKETILELPGPDGKIMRFRIEESPILSPEIAAQFPTWKTYHGYGIDEPTASARLDFTDSGFHAQVFSVNGTFLIDPFQQNDRSNYIVFKKQNVDRTDSTFHCLLEEEITNEKIPVESVDNVPEFSHGTQIRTYRLAVATTFEYTQFFGGQTPALNQVVTTMNRVTGVYRKDFAVSFMLVSGTNLIYNVNPETPANYQNNGSSADLTANQTNIDSIIGAANYDVGHLFQTGNGGVAQLSSVCGSSKARGLSGLPNPSGDPFDVDYVAHELGHQFGANHTFNATTNCGSSPAAARMESGSAVTIMGYAGICNSVANLQRNSIDNFHVYNMTEAITFINGTGSTCGQVAGSNAIPVIAPLANYTIPYETPFMLTASATDANGDALTYSWEHFNAGVSNSNYPGTTDDDDISLVARPALRPYSPTANPSRMFPSLPYILNNANEAPITFSGTSATGSVCAATCITGEDLPSAARTMNFRVAVRDGIGGVADAGTVLTVVNTTTPFRVTTANTAGTSWVGGNQNQVVTWDVSSTNVAPINAANVKISLSTDGGQTFPTVLAASAPNTGSATVAVPSIQTATARIKVEAVGNIFFDINNVNFSIVAPGGPAIIDAGQVTITAESCGTANGMPDPGETLTVSLPLSNSGGSPTTNLTATLQATGGVTNPTPASQNYGAIAPGSPAVVRSFTFTVPANHPCGSPVTLTFVINDGATNYPNVTKTYQTGAAAVSLSQNFDSVTAPALPSGWTNVQLSGTGINWVTDTVSPSSAPNAAFANEPATVNLAGLVSPAVPIQSSEAKLSFKNNYNTENTFDGMVLEFSTNGGTTWTDIVTGGGSFVSGGYNGALATGFSNPLPGRQAWTGNSNGYVDTVVNLPASMNGQTVRFRWLMGTDSSVAGNGVRIDNVQVLGGVECQSCGPTACRIQRKADFNGDGKTDYAVYRPGSGTWFVLPNGGGAASGYNFGTANDVLVPADYDGDGKTDYAVFRNGIWYWVESASGAVRGRQWGTATDIPVAGDYTGDGKADLAVYRPSTGVWYVLNLTNNAMTAVQWGGAASDVPVLGDFDGDCKMDYAVRRTDANGNTTFYVQKSGGGASGLSFGTSAMQMAIGDYNGDGKSDIGVVTIQNGVYRWFATNLANNQVIVNGIPFGQTGDIITVGDYNGDGAADLSVYRPSNGVFYYRAAGNATQFGTAFGAGTDIPVAKYYQP